jgi:hypothetical protein
LLLHYRPAEGEAQTFVFKPSDMLNHESEAIEKRTGWAWAEFLEKLQKGSTLARRVLLWTYLRRVHHTVRFEDIQFKQGELELEFDRDELCEMRAGVEAQAEQPDVDKAAILAVIDAEIAKAAGGEGKAPANSEDSTIPLP